MDIRFADESFYLSNGINLFQQSIAADWGPLYSISYYFLHLFIDDPIYLYYFNFALMAILPSIALYFLLSELNQIYFINFFVAFLYLISEYNLPIWPKVSSFCLLFIFIGLIVIKRQSEKIFHYPSALLLPLLLAYIRPEYLIIILPIVVVILLKLKNSISKRWIMTIIFSVAALLILFGFPYSSERSYNAYAQAFEKYLPISARVDKDGAKSLEQIMQENFGNSKSTTEIFSYDFDKASKHVFYNLRRFPNLLLNLSEVFVPSALLNIDRSLKLFIVLIISSIFIYLLLIKQKNVFLVNSNFKSLFLFSLYLTAPTILSINLYYPRAHYFILLLPPVYLFVGILLSVLKSEWLFKYSTLILITLGAISIIGVPSSKYYFEQSDFVNRESIFFIRQLNVHSHVNLLENEGNLIAYLNDNYHLVDLRNSNTNFISNLSKHKINMIYVTPRLSHLFNANKDSTWLTFQNNFEKYNFISKTDGDKLVLLNKDLISE